MNRRKLQALRNLAERPGTEAEGEVARAKLAEYEKQNPVKPGFADGPTFTKFRASGFAYSAEWSGEEAGKKAMDDLRELLNMFMKGDR